MSRDLVRSLGLSLGVHAFLCMPMVGWLRPAVDPQIDVVRGVQSVELEWVREEADPAGEGEGVSVPRPEPSRLEEATLRGTSLDKSLEEGAVLATTPLSLKNPAPRYPWLARIQGWEGTVLLQVGVSAEGQSIFPRVAASSGHWVLDEAALEAVRGWRFIPARRGKERIASQVEVPITFILTARTKELD